MLVDVNIDGRHPDDIKAWPRVVLSDRGRVQALATHVENALVYFSDTDTGAIYRTDRKAWDVTELTVQQPHVEGKLAILYVHSTLPSSTGVSFCSRTDLGLPRVMSYFSSILNL